jgi:hypothetical protein
MGKPSIFRPEARPGPRRAHPGAARQVGDRSAPEPTGQPDEAVINLRLLLPRPVLARVVGRSIQEGGELNALPEG